MTYKLSILTFAAAIAIALLFVSTNPEKLPAAVFIGLFALVYGFFYGLFALVGIGLRKIGVLAWSDVRVVRTSLAVACLPVFLLVLQSIGQLTVRDILLSSGLFILLYLYFGRVLTQKKQPES